MHAVDASRLDLAREFKRNPVGPHSTELQKILKIMRWDATTTRYLAAQPGAGGAWFLARATGPKGHPLELYRGTAYATLGEASWAVFRMRWKSLTGEGLCLDDDPPDPTAGPVERTSAALANPLLGYADRFSVAQGERIEFKVSSSRAGSYRARIVRLRSGDRVNLGLKQTAIPSPVDGEYPARAQTILAGSFVEVPDPEGALSPPAVSLQAYVWPTSPGAGRQHLLGTWNETTGCGYGLVLDEEGALALLIGDGSERQILSTGVPLLERHWYLVGASISSERRIGSEAETGLWVAQRPVVRYARDDTTAQRTAPLALAPGRAPGFRIAACRAGAGGEGAGGFYNGKLEAPRVGARGLSLSERAALVEHGRPADPAVALLAHWDFSREIPGTAIIDVSGHGRHGHAHNLPTRAMKGVRWDGSEYNWTHRPEHYGAIHFHDDDLYDCGWETDFGLAVPGALPSGLYAAHLVQETEEDWIPFVVRPAPGAARAELALLLPSASYWAYANRHTVIDFPGREQVRGAFASVDRTGIALHHHPELGLSMYDHHSDGSGVCYSSRLRPILSLRPTEALWQLPADTHVIDWLDEKGYRYDVLTEDDLEREGERLLAPYRCVLTGTHPEYPSARMLDAIAAFQAAGGRFVYLGGNGFYWRVSYHPDLPGVIEMRRAEDGIRAWEAEGGEYYHAFTGELGGMWRRMGRAPQSVAGAGMTAQGFDLSTYYERTPASRDPRAAFIFAGVGEAERIGDFGILGGGAAGWEIDRADRSLGTPPHALVVASASDFSANYHWMKEELSHTHAAITGETCPLVRSDMVFYETANGGAVFSTSSIAWAGALSHNRYENNVSRITRNVLDRFLDPRPL